MISGSARKPRVLVLDLKDEAEMQIDVNHVSHEAEQRCLPTATCMLSQLMSSLRAVLCSLLPLLC